jgi:hypothetical protein
MLDSPKGKCNASKVQGSVKEPPRSVPSGRKKLALSLDMDSDDESKEPFSPLSVPSGRGKSALSLNMDSDESKEPFSPLNMDSDDEAGEQGVSDDHHEGKTFEWADWADGAKPGSAEARPFNKRLGDLYALLDEEAGKDATGFFFGDKLEKRHWGLTGSLAMMSHAKRMGMAKSRDAHDVDIVVDGRLQGRVKNRLVRAGFKTRESNDARRNGYRMTPGKDCGFNFSVDLLCAGSVLAPGLEDMEEEPWGVPIPSLEALHGQAKRAARGSYDPKRKEDLEMIAAMRTEDAARNLLKVLGDRGSAVPDAARE